jgi:ribosomal 30S subunit maturation factor RimM
VCEALTYLYTLAVSWCSQYTLESRKMHKRKWLLSFQDINENRKDKSHLDTISLT